MTRLITSALLAAVALTFACSPKPERKVKYASNAIQQGIAGISDELHDCYERYKVGGQIQAMITIQADGSVSAVSLDETHENTPTGACVREALMTKARFGRDAGPTIIRYPLELK